MSCDKVRGLLSAYIDGELSAGELLRVEQHLRRCHLCADEVESLRQTISIVAGMGEVELPSDFHQRLHDRLVALGPPVAIRRQPAAWQRGVRTWVLPAAAAAAVLAVGLGVARNTPDPAGILSTASFIEPTKIAPVAETSTTAPVAANPVGTANPAPTGTNAATSPSGTKTVPTQTPSAPVVATNPSPAPVGTLAKLPDSAYAVSFLDNVQEVTALPARESATYKLTARISDPVKAVAALLVKYPGAQVVANEVVLSVPAAEVDSARINIKQILGQGTLEETPTRVDLARNYQMALTQLQALEKQREQLFEAYASTADIQLFDLREGQLEKLRIDAQKLRENMKIIQGQITRATIIVKLEKLAE